jgi:nicotinate-nucleotide adenylyltransferase
MRPVGVNVTPPRRIGVMGGTFDPIHHGHLVAAAQVAQACRLHEVVFVPTGQPWQKTHAVSPAQHRFLMTLLATVANPMFGVSRVDIDRSGPTYAVDTLADLRAAYGEDCDFFFITGADALASIMTWKDHQRILEHAHLIGVNRPGHPLADPGLPAGAITMVEVTAMAISSTECRRRAAKGLTLDYLVPAAVAQYVVKNGLYR